MRTHLLISILAAALLASGCAGDSKKSHIKEKGEAQWQTARANVMVSLAMDQYKSGNFDKARQTVDEALKLTPDAPAVRVLSAKLAIEQGQLERAESELSLARTAAPNDGEAFYLSGVVCQRWQKPEPAYNFYKAAAEKAPTELAYLMAQSETLVTLDKTDESLELLQAKVIFFEHSAGIRDAVGRLLVTKGRYNEAVDLFRQATILTPEEMTFREGLGMALYYAKQYKPAIDTLTTLIAKDGFTERADLRAALGQCLLENGKPREAREQLEVAVRLQPANSGLWLALARAALESDDLKRADAAVRKATAMDPKAAEGQLLLGYVRMRQERFPDAIAAFAMASSLDRDDSVSVCMIGYVFERIGRADSAMKCYARALRMKPNDEMASQLMAGLSLND